jgi:4-diphosphocytidyl-2-C-methyl-D-erythritol kinase
VDVGERLTATKADATTLTIVNNPALSTTHNSVLNAHALLEKTVGRTLPTHFTLHKAIPIAAGLGGGSADAAAALWALNALYMLGYSAQALAALSLPLGADVPVCVHGLQNPVTLYRMQGIGEVVSCETMDALYAHYSISSLHGVLINPMQALATADVFNAYKEPFNTAGLLPLINDLTPTAIGLCPVVGDVLTHLNMLKLAYHVGMSGSGATCFALTNTADAARKIAPTLPHHWWRHVF